LYISSPSFSIPLWFPVFVVLRELVLMVGGFFLITSGKGAFVSPSLGGKLTTFFHITSIVWLFACGFMGWHPVRTYKLLLPLLALVSLVSLVSYAKEFARCVEKDSSSS
jgi:phosphatidylglycerophosphate synthase